jgi:RimJ/RimL family protein N-acetyltransferase
MRLIPFSPEHFLVLSSWFANESDVVQWGGPLVHFPLDAPQLQSFLAEGTSNPPRRLCWMAEQDGAHTGHVQLGFDWRNGNATLGRVIVNPAARGKGLAAPMLKLAIARAFNFPQIFRLELNVYTFNQPAVRTYAKLGFAHEGIRRSSVQVGDERWDTAIMALLRSDYQPEGLHSLM